MTVVLGDSWTPGATVVSPPPSTDLLTQWPAFVASSASCTPSFTSACALLPSIFSHWPAGVRRRMQLPHKVQHISPTPAAVARQQAGTAPPLAANSLQTAGRMMMTMTVIKMSWRLAAAAVTARALNGTPPNEHPRLHNSSSTGKQPQQQQQQQQHTRLPGLPHKAGAMVLAMLPLLLLLLVVVVVVVVLQADRVMRCCCCSQASGPPGLGSIAAATCCG